LYKVGEFSEWGNSSEDFQGWDFLRESFFDGGGRGFTGTEFSAGMNFPGGFSGRNFPGENVSLHFFIVKSGKKILFPARPMTRKRLWRHPSIL